MTALASARAAAATYRLALMVMSSPRVPARGTPHVIETRVQGKIADQSTLRLMQASGLALEQETQP